jgi:hypothetical protein
VELAVQNSNEALERETERERACWVERERDTSVSCPRDRNGCCCWDFYLFLVLDILWGSIAVVGLVQFLSDLGGVSLQQIILLLVLRKKKKKT